MGCASLENALKIVLLSVIMNSIQHCKSTWISQELINTSACSCLAPPSSLFLAISGCKCISLYTLAKHTNKYVTAQQTFFQSQSPNSYSSEY